MHIILFEDGGVSRLYPITTGKPAFAISVGSLRLIDLVQKLPGTLEFIVRPHLKEIVRQDYPGAWTPEKGPRKGPFLLINARCVPTVDMLTLWQNIIREEAVGSVLYRGTEVITAYLSENTELPDLEQGGGQLSAFLQDMRLGSMKKLLKADMLDSPCDVIRFHMEIIQSNLQFRLTNGKYREIGNGVFVPDDQSPAPEIGDYFVSDSSKGPIVIESGVKIGPFCYIRGPVYIGRNSKVIESSAIKDEVAIGEVCKVGGEVEASTIEPYSNKQHHGFLGHSYLGSWVNLGAGTCNSDLKNSYNEVFLDTASGRVRSGMQFLGCVIGDYSKTAINTSIFTGKTIGACSMTYGFVTTAVPSFVNYARSFGQVTELPVDVMIATQARMFARRDVVQRPCDIQLIRDMFELTQRERQLASEPLSL